MPSSLKMELGLGGRHLEPQEFHAILEEYWGSVEISEPMEAQKSNPIFRQEVDECGQEHRSNQSSCTSEKKQRKKLVVIDVRNRIEVAVGRFQHPGDPAKRAVDPSTKTFSQFATYSDQHADELKDCKVLSLAVGSVRYHISCLYAAFLVHMWIGAC